MQAELDTVKPDLASKTTQINNLTAQLQQLTQRFTALELANHATNQGNQAAGGNPARVDSACVPKIPPLIHSDPELWFVQVKASFRNTNITVESTKVDYLCFALVAEAMSCLKDIILLDPRPDDIYQRIKARIISTFGTSAEHFFKGSGSHEWQIFSHLKSSAQP